MHRQVAGSLGEVLDAPRGRGLHVRLGLLAEPLDLELAMGLLHIAGAVHLLENRAVLLRALLRGFRHLADLVEGAGRVADGLGELLPHLASFRQFAGSFSGRCVLASPPLPAGTLPFPRLPALLHLEPLRDLGGLRGGEGLPRGVLIALPEERILEVDECNGDLCPAEELDGPESAMAGDEPPLWGHYHGMEEPHLADALGERLEVAEVPAGAGGDLDGVEFHVFRCGHRGRRNWH
jgi:hypothetical protein